MKFKDAKLIQIRLVGIDRPGVTSSVTQMLAKYHADILDIKQVNIQKSTTLGLLCALESSEVGQALNMLNKYCKQLPIKVKIEEIPLADYNKWVTQQGKNNYILTLLGRKITAEQLAITIEVLESCSLTVTQIKRLTGRIPLDETRANLRACIRFSLRGTLLNKVELQKEMMQAVQHLDVDYSLQEDTMYRRMRRLICFDMDSTLIQTEVIDELAHYAGVGKQVKAITASAMRGEIDFKKSFEKRVSLLKGLDAQVMTEIALNLPITEGLDRMMKVLKIYGYKTAILSGGFTFFGKHLQSLYGIDYVFANQLEVSEGKLTGKYIGEVIDGPRKVELLHEIAAKEGISIDQTVAIGDGANDLPMLNAAGLGIAFHAKPKVKANAEFSINTLGLDGILYLLGFDDSNLDELGRL